MKPVFQDDTSQYGDCFASCVASLFEVDKSTMPKFSADNADKFWELWREWFEHRNLHVITILPGALATYKGVHIAAVTSRRYKGGTHAVLVSGGKVIHDPGECSPPYDIEEVEQVDLLLPIDPAQPIGPFH